MKRLFRLSFSLLSTLSFLMLTVILILWYRGHSIAGESLLLRHASDGPPWQRLRLQGWSSAGGVRLAFITEGTSTPPSRPIPGVATPPDWTPFGQRGWQSSYDTYNTTPYPVESFMAHTWSWHGFQFCHDSSASPASWQRQRSFTLPAWFLSLLLAIVPACSISSFLRRRSASRRRARLGLCPRCNYDLRATPGRCPECGHVPVKVKSRR